MISLIDIENSLAAHVPRLLDLKGLTRAAVALIISRSETGLRMLFIERAANDNDPWSGNICFPGGKVENGDGEPRLTAERETWEEVGLDLSTACFLGRLSDIASAHFPLQVSCFVYLLEDVRPFRLMSEEVRDAFWVPFEDLLDPARHGEKIVRFDGHTMVQPGLSLPRSGEPVLWGMTYRFVLDFLGLATAEAR